MIPPTASGEGSQYISVYASVSNGKLASWLSKCFGVQSEPTIRMIELNERLRISELMHLEFNVLIVEPDLDDIKNARLPLLRNLLTLRKDIRALVVAEDPSREDVVASFRAGAHGIVEARAPSSHLLSAISWLHRGQVWAAHSHLEHLLEAVADNRGGQYPSTKLRNKLSPRELEIARHVVEGRSNKEIAAALDVSQHTVRNHLVRIFTKLRISSRTEAIFKIMSMMND
jgi:DNA-binding NarL/FixJ family response regulator